jgi:uncharacterized protein YbgA (DUF1722 family)
VIGHTGIVESIYSNRYKMRIYTEDVTTCSAVLGKFSAVKSQYETADLAQNFRGRTQHLLAGCENKKSRYCGLYKLTN